jgi:hypothetical protein
MSELSGNGHYVPCPLCEGKGQMHGSELLAKLADRNLQAKLAACREQLIKQYESRQAEKTKAADSRLDFEQEVLKGPVTRILWRRSSKE